VTKIGMDIDSTLERRLNTYLIKQYNRTHGYHHVVMRKALIEFLDNHWLDEPEPHEEKSAPIEVPEVHEDKGIARTPAVREPAVIAQKEPATISTVTLKTKELLKNEVLKRKVKELLSEGVSMTEIGERLGYKGNQISKLRRAMIKSGELKE